MRAIVAVDEKWGIGRENKLLFSVPKDMAFFRETTKGAVVVMGRKTLESFPGGRPLKNRVNVVLTRDKTPREGCLVANGVAEAFEILKKRTLPCDARQGLLLHLFGCSLGYFLILGSSSP